MQRFWITQWSLLNVNVALQNAEALLRGDIQNKPQ